ncbi:MAG: insulinase family protein, partial [Pseudomonadota bacterium]
QDRRPLPPQPRPPKEPRRTTPEQAIEFMEKQQAHLVVGYPGTTFRAKDRFVLEVLLAILSGQGGRLFLELRDRQGLAYRLSAFSVEGEELGYVAAYIATSPENVNTAEVEIEKQFQLLRDRLVPKKELDRIKNYLVGAYEVSLQRKSTLAACLTFNEIYGVGYRTYLKYSDSIFSVTAEDLRSAARKYLNNDKRVLAIVKP